MKEQLQQKQDVNLMFRKKYQVRAPPSAAIKKTMWQQTCFIWVVAKWTRDFRNCKLFLMHYPYCSFVKLIRYFYFRCKVLSLLSEIVLPFQQLLSPKSNRGSMCLSLLERVMTITLCTSSIVGVEGTAVTPGFGLCTNECDVRPGRGVSSAPLSCWVMKPQPKQRLAGVNDN